MSGDSNLITKLQAPRNTNTGHRTTYKPAYKPQASVSCHKPAYKLQASVSCHKASWLSV